MTTTGHLAPSQFLGKFMEQINLETISKCMNAQKGTVNGHNGFMNNKSCLVSMSIFCDGMAGLVKNGRAVGITNLDFSKILLRCYHIL